MTRRLNIATATTLWLAVAWSTSAVSDVDQEFGPDVLVEKAIATSGSVGERSRIQFRIVNEGGTDMHLLGISTAVAEHAELIADVGNGKLVKLDSISIPADSTLDLTTSHLRYEIYPLRRDLRVGDEFQIDLDFVSWTTAARVHVH